MDNVSGVTDDAPGAAVPQVVGSASDTAYAAPGMAYAGADPADVEKNKVFGVLAYLGILFLVPLLAAKDSRFAMYHANQGLVLFLFGVAVGIVIAIPVLGWIIAPIGGLAHLVFMIMGIVSEPISANMRLRSGAFGSAGSAPSSITPER